jgi:hypothetical protein
MSFSLLNSYPSHFSAKREENVSRIVGLPRFEISNKISNARKSLEAKSLGAKSLEAMCALT